MAGFDVTTLSEIEITQLDLTVSGIARDVGRSGILAEFLNDPQVSSDEKTYVIQQLARSPDNGAQMALFNEDAAVIGPALEAAFNRQALNTDDLVGIAQNTEFALINPSLQLVSMLSTNPDEPNNALAALSNHLVDPVNGLSEDQVTAGYIGLASDQDHLDQYIQDSFSLPPHANVPGRREIFERIVDFNDANRLPPGFDPESRWLRGSGLGRRRQDVRCRWRRSYQQFPPPTRILPPSPDSSPKARSTRTRHRSISAMGAILARLCPM